MRQKLKKALHWVLYSSSVRLVTIKKFFSDLKKQYQIMYSKKSISSQVWTDSEGESWLVKYHYEGSFTIGSAEEPPEFPELEIDSITSISDGRDFGEPTQELMDYIDSHHSDDDFEDFFGN